MDKRVVVAAAVSVIILVAWGYLFPPPERPTPPATTPPAESRDVGPVETEPLPDPIAQGEQVEDAEDPINEIPLQADMAQELAFENDQYQVVLTNRGGVALSWKLRGYTTRDGAPLELMPSFHEQQPLMLGIELDDLGLAETLNNALYTVERSRVDGSEGIPPGERVAFRWSDGRGLAVTKAMTFRDGQPLVDVQVEVTDRGRRLPARLMIGPGFGAQEPTDGRYYYAGQAVWIRGGSVTRLKPKKVVKEPGRFTADVTWVGLEDQYFAALVLPNSGPTEVSWRAIELTAVPLEDDAEAEAADHPILAVSVPPEGVRLFLGAKKYTALRELGNDLDRAVWFATNPFLGWIARLIFLCLIWIHDHTIHNYGLAIVLSTFLLRVLLFPVNQYSMVSMKKTQMQMQRLQPKIKAIRNRYKKVKDAESRGKMNQETMELYRQEGVNPMGGLNGCLPLLAQFPILIGFYNMLTVAVELRGAPFFGWISDLSQADPWYVTPILMGVTMFWQQRMAMSKIKDPVQQQQQRFMMFMPFMFTWICLQMPSGLVLYWFVNNILGIGQQWLVNRHTSRLEEAAQKA